MFNLKLIKKMETKQMNVEFLDTEDLRESCVVNGSRLISEDIVPEESYYRKVQAFFDTFEYVNVSKMADGIERMELEGMDLAMFAFTAGHIAASSSTDLCMKVIKTIHRCDGKCTKALQASQKAAQNIFNPRKAAIASVFQFGVICYVAGNVQEIMMKALMEGMGGILGSLGGK